MPYRVILKPVVICHAANSLLCTLLTLPFYFSLDFEDGTITTVVDLTQDDNNNNMEEEGDRGNESSDLEVVPDGRCLRTVYHLFIVLL